MTTEPAVKPVPLLMYTRTVPSVKPTTTSLRVPSPVKSPTASAVGVAGNAFRMLVAPKLPKPSFISTCTRPVEPVCTASAMSSKPSLLKSMPSAAIATPLALAPVVLLKLAALGIGRSCKENTVRPLTSLGTNVRNLPAGGAMSDCKMSK